jgi:Protein of unknown function (DUF3180)
MKPTRVWMIVLTALVCGAATWLVLRVAYRTLPPLPWSGAPTLLIVAVAEAYTGTLLRARILRRPGTKPVEALAVARMAALAKASAYTAAVIGGITAGFIIEVAGSLEKAIPRHDALVAIGTLGAAVALAATALYLEYCCRVPRRPGEDEERHRASLP